MKNILEFDDELNSELLSRISNKLNSNKREQIYGLLINEVERPTERLQRKESGVSFKLKNGMTRIISASDIETLRELGKIYSRVGWVPNGLVSTHIDKYEIELRFDSNKINI